jgi:hypothetical protein
MRARFHVTVLGVGLLLLLTSCSDSQQNVPNVPEPWCDNWPLLMLEAQSVPSAQLIPCVDTVPLGWSAQPARVDDKGTSFILDSSIAGDEAVRVELQHQCDSGGAVRVPSDVSGAERYEWIADIVSGFSGRRTYVFEGGCVVLTFDFGVEAAAALVNEVSLAVGYVQREAINEAVRVATDGREQLDPEPTS